LFWAGFLTLPVGNKKGINHKGHEDTQRFLVSDFLSVPPRPLWLRGLTKGCDDERNLLFSTAPHKKFGTCRCSGLLPSGHSAHRSSGAILTTTAPPISPYPSNPKPKSNHAEYEMKMAGICNPRVGVSHPTFPAKTWERWGTLSVSGEGRPASPPSREADHCRVGVAAAGRSPTAASAISGESSLPAAST
jgi:hypothetical protein